MIANRFLLAAFALLAFSPVVDAQLFPRKSKPDAARVRSLGESLRSDPDEKKRRAAIAELKETDPRAQADAIAVLVAVLQRDPSPTVRAEAAAAIGQCKLMVPLAGVALEVAAENDPSPLVRDAAQQSLWEYHLIGYRSARGADGIAGQTKEPPKAKPTSARVIAGSGNPVVTIAANPIAPEPPLAPLPTPRSGGGIPTLITAAPPPQLNASPEPPFARPSGSANAVPDAPVSDIALPPVTLPPDAALKLAPSWSPPRVLPNLRPKLLTPWRGR